MQRAAALVRAWGFLDYAQGRRPQLRRPRRRGGTVLPGETALAPPAAALPPPRPAPSSFDQLLAFFRDKLESGEYPAGTPLPKSLYFIRRFHVSGHTLSAVLRLLEAEGLLHKAGRQYRAGRKATSFRGRGGQAPLLLLVEKNLRTWDSLHNLRTQAFCQEFDKEAQRCGIRIIPMPVEGRPSTLGHFEPGNIAERGRELGDRLLGALIVGDKADLALREPGLRALNALKRPMVWFDRNDTGLPEGWAAQAGLGRLVRLHFSEEAACREALHELHRFGHRHLVFPRIFEEPWMENRFRLLQALAASSFTGLVLEKPPPLQDLYGELAADRAGKAAFAERCLRRARKYPDQVEAKALETALKALKAGARAEDLYFLFHKADGLIFLSPGMDAVLRHPRATALLAPHDWVGRKCLHWLLLQNIPVPESLSVLSFDNHRSKLWDPLSSVDFGFGFLGHAALHHLLGDIPIKPNRRGEIAARAKVVDRGSVGGIVKNAFELRRKAL